MSRGGAASHSGESHRVVSFGFSLEQDTSLGFSVAMEVEKMPFQQRLSSKPFGPLSLLEKG